MCVRNLLADSSWNGGFQKVALVKNHICLPPLFCNVHLVLQVPSVCCLCMLNLPTQILYFSFQLSLLVLKLQWNDQWRNNCPQSLFIVSPNVSWGTAPCSKHMDMCIAGCIYKEIDFDLECTSIITIKGYSILNISYSYCLMTNLHFASSFAESNKYCQSIQVPLPLITFSWNKAIIKWTRWTYKSQTPPYLDTVFDFFQRHSL